MREWTDVGFCANRRRSEYRGGRSGDEYQAARRHIADRVPPAGVCASAHVNRGLAFRNVPAALALLPKLGDGRPANGTVCVCCGRRPRGLAAAREPPPKRCSRAARIQGRVSENPEMRDQRPADAPSASDVEVCGSGATFGRVRQGCAGDDALVRPMRTAIVSPMENGRGRATLSASLAARRFTLIPRIP